MHQLKETFAENKKPKLLVYGISWREPRNAIFTHHLSHYFNVLVVTGGPINNELHELAKPAVIVPVKFIFSHKIGFAFTPFFRKILRIFEPQFILSLETHSVSAYQSIKIATKLKIYSIVFSWQNLTTIPKIRVQKILQKFILAKSSFLIAGSIDTKNYLSKTTLVQFKNTINNTL